MEIDLSPPGSRVIHALNQIIEWRGKPKAIRCDNGPEYESISQVQEAATRWLWAYNHDRPNMAIGDITSMQKLMAA